MKMFETTLVASAMGAVVVLAAPANAAITITQGASAPTYTYTQNFDAGPTGNNVAANSWVANGLGNIHGGQNVNSVTTVGDINAIYPWLPDTTNAAYDSFGMFINFTADQTEVSFQGWATPGSGPFGSPPSISLFNDGTQVGFASLTSDWGGATNNSWYNIVATGGDSFDEIVFTTGGFFPELIIDNVSWGTAPAPGAFALLGLAGLVGGRRRRSN